MRKISRQSSPRTSRLGPTARTLQRVYGHRSPVSLYLDRARLIQRETGIKGPPFDPYKYAEALRITVVEKDDMTLDGMLKCDGKGNFSICLKKNAPVRRKNFTLAHEIAHTFFYDELTQSESFRQASNADREEESLCDIAAAELLMPAAIFKKDLLRFQDDDRITPFTLFRLQSAYNVSLQAVAIKAASVVPGLTCAIWSREGSAVNISAWIVPKKLRPFLLWQTGKSSIEEALGGRRWKIVTKVDIFYTGRQQQKIVRETSSLKMDSCRAISVILPTGRQNAAKCSTNMPIQSKTVPRQLNFTF